MFKASEMLARCVVELTQLRHLRRALAYLTEIAAAQASLRELERLERWRRGEEHALVFRRTRVWFPAPTSGGSQLNKKEIKGGGQGCSSSMDR